MKGWVGPNRVAVLRYATIACIFSAALLSACEKEGVLPDPEPPSATKEFRPSGRAESIFLPADAETFEDFVRTTGASYARVGKWGNSPLSSPRPLRPGCRHAPSALVFTYPIAADGVMPGYAAYIEDQRVVCVEARFAYPDPTF